MIKKILIVVCCWLWIIRANAFNPLDPHHHLFLPAGKPPFPAILLLHASGGVEQVTLDWGRFLQQRGYAVYIIDSFTPRGYKDRKSIGWDKATQAQLADAFPAYQYLSARTDIDPQRIALMGFSMGGADVLTLVSRESTTFQPFKAAIAFYGVCKRLPPQTRLYGPLVLFIGAQDDRATLQDCEKLITTNRKYNHDLYIKQYANALHGFDNPFFLPTKTLTDERGEQYHVGFNQQAQQQSKKDVLQFLNEWLK